MGAYRGAEQSSRLFTMKSITLFLSIACASVSLLTGCIAYVGVKKVEPGTNPKGLRVKLPAPFVVGRPDASGTIDYKIEHFPDPDEEYAINAWALMAKNKVVLNRTMAMYLSSAQTAQDTASVAAAAIGKAGEVATETLKTQQAAETTAATAQKTKADAVATALATAQSDLLVKAIASEKALLKYQDQQGVVAAADGAVVAAETKVANATAGAAKDAANAELTASKEALITAKGTLANLEQEFNLAEIDRKAAEKKVKSVNTANFNLASALEMPARAKLAVPGAVIYRIVEPKDGGGIRLERVRFTLFSMNGRKLINSAAQLRHPTWGAKPKEEAKE